MDGVSPPLVRRMDGAFDQPLGAAPRGGRGQPASLTSLLFFVCRYRRYTRAYFFPHLGPSVPRCLRFLPRSAMLCAVLSVCMGVLGTASRLAGRALGATRVHCAGLGTLSAGKGWCLQLVMLWSLWCILWCWVLLPLFLSCLLSCTSGPRAASTLGDRGTTSCSAVASAALPGSLQLFSGAWSTIGVCTMQGATVFSSAT